jgi:hypothetical protein
VDAEIDARSGADVDASEAGRDAEPDASDAGRDADAGD